MKRDRFLLMVFLFTTFSLVEIKAQVIPESRRVDWKVAGFQGTKPNYKNVRDITTFGGSGNGITPNDAALQAAIVSLGNDSGIIYFPAGNYSFLSNIALRSGLVLKGQDAASTTLLFNLGGSNNLISVSGSATTDTANLTSSAFKNANTVTIDNAAIFKVDDYVKIYQNDTALVNDGFALNTVGQIVRIQNITGNTVTFYNALRRNYSLADAPKIKKIIMTTGVGIECLKIKRLDSTSTQTSNIQFNYTTQCWLKGIESDSCNFAHVQIDNSTNIDITGSYFHGSFGYGGGGQGYGVAVETTSGECLIENNIFKHLRHSMLLQSGANGNVFTYNYSREPFKSESSPFDLSGDIVLHGNYPYANLFEGNIVQNIVVDASHRINGPYNTFFRNRAESYGILMSAASGDSTNIVGNEITGTGFNKGNYITSGNGNFHYGNNVNGTIIPAGTISLTDNSYYYNSTPGFWNLASAWPSIGLPNTINSGTIPAKQRFDAGTNLTVCSQGTALPVNSFSFSIKALPDRNIVMWQTGNADVAKFEVERSTDAIHFIKLAELSVKMFGDNSYQFPDEQPFKGINYYRIKQVSKSGSYTYSNIISTNNSISTIVRIFPNPSTNNINVNLDKDFTKCEATIKNIAGLVMMKQVFNGTGSHHFDISVSKLPKGIYLLEVKDLQTGNTVIQKFIKD